MIDQIFINIKSGKGGDGAISGRHEKFIPIIKAIELLAKKCAKESWKIEEKDFSKVSKFIEKPSILNAKKIISKIIKVCFFGISNVRIVSIVFEIEVGSLFL